MPSVQFAFGMLVMVDDEKMLGSIEEPAGTPATGDEKDVRAGRLLKVCTRRCKSPANLRHSRAQIPRLKRSACHVSNDFEMANVLAQRRPVSGTSL
jgi:hypothetical protein